MADVVGGHGAAYCCQADDCGEVDDVGEEEGDVVLGERGDAAALSMFLLLEPRCPKLTNNIDGSELISGACVGKSDAITLDHSDENLAPLMHLVVI